MSAVVSAQVANVTADLCGIYNAANSLGIDDSYEIFYKANHLDKMLNSLGIHIGHREVPLYDRFTQSLKIIDWQDLKKQSKSDGGTAFFLNGELIFELLSTMCLTHAYSVTEWGIRRSIDEIIPLRSRKAGFDDEESYIIEIVVYYGRIPHSYLVMSDPDYVYTAGFVHQQKMPDGNDARIGMLLCPSMCDFKTDDKKVSCSFKVNKQTFEKSFKALAKFQIKTETGEELFSASNRNCTTFVTEFISKHLQIDPNVDMECFQGVLEILFLDSSLKRISDCFFSSLDSHRCLASIIRPVIDTFNYVGSVSFCSTVKLLARISNFGSFSWKDIFLKRCKIHSPLQLGRWIGVSLGHRKVVTLIGI